MSARKLAFTEELSNGAARELLAPGDQCLPAGALVFEHRPASFPNYPYEWAPEMLLCAAGLTLRLAFAALDHGFGLKDATPYNIMFEGPHPLFLDILSFTRRDPLDIIWQPYAQFVQIFVYPLLVNRYFGIRLVPDQAGFRASPRRRAAARPHFAACGLSTLLSFR